MNNLLVTAIIPTYNGEKLLNKCLKSLSRQTTKFFEIIIVDNGSTNKLKIFQYNNIKIISLDKNYGFSKACNEAIKHASTDLIALINNDILLEENWLKNILKSANHHPEISIFSSKILKLNKQNIIESVGDQISSNLEIKHRGEGEKDIGQYDQEENIFLAPATATLYKKQFFEKVGYFDEDFFMYFEDVDIAFRGQLYGYKYLYVPQAKAYHIGKATAKKIESQIGFYELRNSIITWIKNIPKKLLFYDKTWLVLIIFYIKLSLITFNIKKIILFFYVILNVLKCLPIIIEKRKIIQKKIKVDEKYIIYNVIKKI